MGREAEGSHRGVEAGQQDDGSEASSTGSSLASGAAPVARAGRSHYTPLFRSQNEDRYLRRDLICEYQQEHGCRLAIMIDQITPDSVTYLAELLHDPDPSRDLHLILCSPGGDGEVAVRLARMAQASCRELTVVVPEIAKSAATILALGAHHVLMGPTSDLGPIDPQVLVGQRGFVSAKDLISAVERALDEVAEQPDTYPLHAALLGGIDATAVEFARSALNRTSQLARQAVASNPDRSEDDIDELLKQITEPFVNEPSSHGAVVGASEARHAGLPVHELQPTDAHWQSVWNLWTRYFVLGPLDRVQVYENEVASQVRTAG